MNGRVRHNGFTLLELLVTLAILALVSALVPATYSAVVPRARLESDALDLARQLRRARNEAVLHATTLSVLVGDETFRVGSDTYRFAGAERVTVLRPLPAADQDAADTEPRRIDFHADGSSSGGSIVISVGQDAYRIDIDWLTGRVRVGERRSEG